MGTTTDTNVVTDGVTFHMQINTPILVSKPPVRSNNDLSVVFLQLSPSHFFLVTWQGAVTTAALMSLDYVHAVGGEGDVLQPR